MRALVYATSSLIDPHFGILLEEAETLCRQGHEVTFAYCHGVSRYCNINVYGDPLSCRACHYCARKLIKKYLSRSIEIVPLPKITLDETLSWEYHSVQDIKKIVYRDVYIGYGVMSSYTSATRDPDPDFSCAEIKKYFDFALHHAKTLTDEMYRLVDEIKPDAISIFTGRLIDNRPLFDIAQKYDIDVRVNECIGGLRSQSDVKRIIYYNHLPHSISYNTKLLEKVWEMDNEPLAEKERKGRDFFERRRGGIPAGDRVYIGKQKKGLLPDDWDADRRNIVIFNSSEDEFSAVGREFDRYNFFPSQIAGIRYLLEQFSSAEYHFYLRVHPNLSKIRFKYHSDLYLLPEQYKNLTVIGADDPCSTYDLLDAAEKVIVFGSTMGAEAAYWQKPVILLGGAFYYLLDVCYTPHTLSELNALVAERLRPKDPYNAIRYGYYLLNREWLTIPAQFVDYSVRKLRLFRYEFSTSAYMKTLGSVALDKIIRLALLLWAMYRKYIPLPAPLFAELTPAGRKTKKIRCE